MVLSGKSERMTLVTRYLSVSRVESEANNDLRASLLGSDSISGLYKQEKSALVTITWYIEGSLCCLGVMSVVKENDSRSAKRFPSQQNSSESVRRP